MGGFSECMIFHVSMPHAALWVVQLPFYKIARKLHIVSMPHAALWVVQRSEGSFYGNIFGFQCRTRLCGWCSGGFLMYNINSKPFQCRTRLCEWCSLNWNFFISPSCAFQCRTRLCGWCSVPESYPCRTRSTFQCRTRLCGWCSRSSHGSQQV